MQAAAGETAGQKDMGIGEASAVTGEKPQALADMSPFAGSVNAFTDALGRSVGSASSMQAEPLPPVGPVDPKQVGFGENIEPPARMGEDLVWVGARKEDFASLEIDTKALVDSGFTFTEAARNGRYLPVPSFDELKKDPAALAVYANEQARTNGLYPSDPFEGADWRPLGEFAPISQNAICDGIALPAAAGTGGAFLAAGGDALALPIVLESGAGFGNTNWLSPFAELGPGPSFGMELIGRGKEEILAGANLVSLVGAVATDALVGQVVDRIVNTSILTGEDLTPIAGQRSTGDILDVFGAAINIPGLGEFVLLPEAGETFEPRSTSADLTLDDTFGSAPEQWLAGSTDVDDVAAYEEQEPATAGLYTASTIEDETDEIAPSDTAYSFRTAWNDDADDTIRVQEYRSGEVSRPFDVTRALASRTTEITIDTPDLGDIVEIRYAAASAAPQVVSSPSAAAGVTAAPGDAAPSRSVDQIIGAYVSGRPFGEITNSVAEDDVAPIKERLKRDLRRNGHDEEIADQISQDQYLLMAVAEGIYSYPYQPAPVKVEPKAESTITAAQLSDQLKQYQGPTERPDIWTVRPNRFSPDTPLDQNWMNAKPAHFVDPASGGAGGDSSGSGGDRREQRRHRGGQTGSRKSP